jgi:integrase
MNNSQKRIKDIFTILLFTGMAWIDYKQLDLNLHLRNGNITKERSKTKTGFCVPIHKRVDEILQSGKPIIADQAFNRQLKNLLSTLGSYRNPVSLQKKNNLYVTEPFYRCVSSHTGRHTFIDRLLRRNVPINIIMGYVGHSNPGQLLSYAKKAGINEREDFVSTL